MEKLKKMIVKMLRETAMKIERGDCELSSSEAMEIMSVLSHEALSKEGACRHLNISRSKFDDMVREGTMPRGRKRVGFKELYWYKDELNSCLEFLKESRNKTEERKEK